MKYAHQQVAPVGQVQMTGNYAICEGGIGWQLLWHDGTQWQWLMDGIHRDEVYEEMWTRYREDLKHESR